jgi:hypothetical protein
MRTAFCLFPTFALAACGARVSSQPGAPPDGGAGDEATATSADTGPDRRPIDTSGLPTALAMNCGGSASSIAFKLPCLVYPDPTLNATACFAFDDGSPHPHPVLLFWVPLEYLAAHRNEPVNLSDIPQPQTTLSPLISSGVEYRLTRIGTITASQVDIVAHTYVGRFQSVEFTGKGDGGDAIVCSATGAPFWAVPGFF